MSVESILKDSLNMHWLVPVVGGAEGEMCQCMPGPGQET